MARIIVDKLKNIIVPVKINARCTVGLVVILLLLLLLVGPPTVLN